MVRKSEDPTTAPQASPPVPKEQGPSWDPFGDGVCRGVPGIDADIDQRINGEPWKQE